MRIDPQRMDPKGSLANVHHVDANARCFLQVEPQEKKKTPKGRAKKRITYIRRFVTVQMTGGKRKVRREFESTLSPLT